MQKERFINRKQEQAWLQEKYETLHKGELVAIYGRRRVGKTELVRQFSQKITGEKLYLYIDLASKQELLQAMNRAVESQLHETIRFGDFDTFFEFLHAKARKHRFLLVIDEFQRFLDVAPEFITRLQHVWDDNLKEERIMIILVGSSIGMVQRIFESRAGALYGRGTRQKISPFRYCDFRMMFPSLTEEEKVVWYAVFGGTPYYLERTLAFTDIQTAIRELILKKGGMLSEEPRLLMEVENMKIHAKYNSILHAIASGKELLKEMQDFTKIPATTIPPYMQKLDELLDLVERKDPVLGKERLGRYTMKDNFFKFWYRFIFPNQTALNLGNTSLVAGIIKDNLNSYVGKIFEDIAKELLILHLNKTMQGSRIAFEEIGSWWDRSGNEIDIVAHSPRERQILVGEVKWTNHPVDLNIIEGLQQKAELLHFNGHHQYLIVSKSGFTGRCMARMKELNAISLDLREMTGLFDKLEH